jgi:hypothetical protein
MTYGKVLVGVTLVICGYFVVTAVMAPKTAAKPAAPSNTSTQFLGGFVTAIGNLFNSAGNTKTQSDASGVPFVNGGGGTWDTTNQVNNIPLLPYTPAYADSTTNDNLLA